MKIDKVALYLHQAARVAAKKLGILAPSYHAIQCLYIISNIQPCSGAQVARYQQKSIGTYSPHWVSRSLAYLLEAKLIDRSDYTYRLSPLGREYLTRIRKYLLNVRL